jgi:hypothetical protein
MTNVSHKTMQLLGQFTETEHKTKHYYYYTITITILL